MRKRIRPFVAIASQNGITLPAPLECSKCGKTIEGIACLDESLAINLEETADQNLTTFLEASCSCGKAIELLDWDKYKNKNQHEQRWKY